MPNLFRALKPFRMQDLFAILMAVWLLGCMAFQYHPRTREGVQCPTAPVQTVRVAVKDCCDRITGFKEVVPQPGQATFVQCRCAEKNQVHNAAGLPPRLEPFFVPFFELRTPPIEPAPRAEHAYAASCLSYEEPPSVRPPAAV